MSILTDFLFKPSGSPNIDCLLSNLNVRRLDVIRKQLISGGVIVADELFTNVSATIWYFVIGMTFYNIEGANRTLNFRDNTPTIIFTTGTVPTGGTVYFTVNNNMYFNSIQPSLALINASTSLTGMFYRINL